MSRVVVTGGSGFIGQHVMRMLVRGGHSAYNLDRRNRFEPQEIASAVLPESEAIIHCAARADVRSNWDQNGGTLDQELIRDNEQGTHGLLHFASTAKIKTFVFVSTGALYAKQMSPYAASKLTGEVWAKAYADKFGWNLYIVRPAACYGAGYHHGHIADFVHQARQTGRVKSITAGLARDGVHAKDVAQWLATLATLDSAENAQLPPAVYYLRGAAGWGCRDTVEMMGVEAEWGEPKTGWLGDVDGVTSRPSDLPCDRPIRNGVRDSLISLGWTL